MIIPVYKPLGASTHQLAHSIGLKLGEKASHTGTLDPLAEGVVIVVTGTDRLDKQAFAHWKKTYTFTVLFGVETDTFDVLGIPMTDTTPKLQERLADTAQVIEDSKQAFAELTGTYSQELPAFSARRTGDGESFFDLAKRGEQIPLTYENITVHSLATTSHELLSPLTVCQQVSKKIETVIGDFRQEEIKHCWRTTTQKLTAAGVPQLLLMHCSATTSKRTYVRGIVRDLGKKLGLPLTTFAITRTHNGPYSTTDCTIL
jgi:tRNA pseudouridine(55) synthase